MRAIELLSTGFRRLHKKKFAFLLHDPSMLVHYVDVWKAIGPSKFVIVLTDFFSSDPKGNPKLGISGFFDAVRKEGYEIWEIKDVISCGIRFEYVVTNHVISGSTVEVGHETVIDLLKKTLNRFLRAFGRNQAWEYEVDITRYLPLQIGNGQVRYMYGADISDGWSLASWNRIYDIFLCHGVNDEREIGKRFSGKTFVMGYPRYDRFFSDRINTDLTKQEFQLSNSKKTLLWMPTLGGDYSSIPLFAEPLSALRNKYNIIVRPHPLSFVQEADFIALLERYQFHIDRFVLRDMNELFSVADVVLVDNGGTPFSAIFLGKNVIFLRVPDDLGADSAASAHISGSSVLELKRYLPSVVASNIGALEDMLGSDEFYANNLEQVGVLFKKYFDSPRGGGAKRVAEIFGDLH